MNCRDAIAKLYGYLDGEIGYAEREAIAAHLQACRPCFDEFEAERLFQALVIERTPRPEVREEFKTQLLARLSEERDSTVDATAGRGRIIPMLQRFAIAAVLVLAVGVGAAYLNDRIGPKRSNWVTLAFYHHDLLPVEEVGIETADYSEAKSFVINHLGPSVSGFLPDALPAGVTVHETCIMPFKDGQLAQVELKADQAGSVSLFLVPSGAFRMGDEARVNIGSRTYRTVRLGCCRAVCWRTDGDYVCALIGDCDPSYLLAYAESWNNLQTHSASGSFSSGSIPRTAWEQSRRWSAAC